MYSWRWRPFVVSVKSPSHSLSSNRVGAFLLWGSAGSPTSIALALMVTFVQNRSNCSSLRIPLSVSAVIDATSWQTRLVLQSSAQVIGVFQQLTFIFKTKNIPHVTQTFGTISEKAGPKTWTEIPQTINLHQNKNIFSRWLKKTITSPNTTKSITYFYTLTAGNYHCSIWVSVPCMGVWWRCVSPRGVGVPGWDSCVHGVGCLDVLCVVMCSGWVCPAVVFARCASPSQWVHVWAVCQAKPFF